MNNTTTLRSLLLTTLTWALRAGAAVLVLFLITRYVGAPLFSINQTTTQKQGSFNVTGTSEITTVPDKAEVSVGVQVLQPTVAQTQEEMNRIINAVTQEMRALGIAEEDITTRNYNLYPEYDFENGRSIRGYSGSTMLVIKVTDFTRLNQAIDRATAAGANQVQGIEFGLTEEKEEELQKQARKEAIDEAKANARELANLAGLNLGRVINVSESKGGAQPPQMMMLARDGAGGGIEESAPTQIEPGSTTFSYTVVLSYETE